jgi:hypothetical protein
MIQINENKSAIERNKAYIILLTIRVIHGIHGSASALLMMNG